MATAMDLLGFRRTLSHFPRPVCLISSSHQGIDHVSTAGTFVVISFAASTVGVTLHHRSRLTAMVRESGVWGVSLLARHHLPLARYFAQPHRPTGEGFADHPTRRGPVTGVPLLADAVTVLECRTAAVLTAADHLIFVGQPVWASDGDAGLQPLCDFRGALVGPPV